MFALDRIKPKPKRARFRPAIEPLDDRVVPAMMISIGPGMGLGFPPRFAGFFIRMTSPLPRVPVGYHHATPVTPGTNTVDLKNGPLAKLGNDLATLYNAYQKGGINDPAVISLQSKLRIEGDRVGIDVRPNGELDALKTELTKLGMTIEQVDPRTKMVEGLIPIARLADLAASSRTSSIVPIHRPATGGFPRFILWR